MTQANEQALREALKRHDVELHDDPRTGTRVSTCKCGEWSLYDGRPFFEHIVVALAAFEPQPTHVLSKEQLKMLHEHDPRTCPRCVFDAALVSESQLPMSEDVRKLALECAHHVLDYPSEYREWRKLWWRTPTHEDVAKWFEQLLADALREEQRRALEEAAATVERWSNGWKQRIADGMYQGQMLQAADIRRDEGMDLVKHIRALAARGGARQ